MATAGVVPAFQTILEATKDFVPALFYATVLLVVGYILGRITYSVVNRVLEHTQVDEYFEEEGHLELELSRLFAELGKWIIYFVFLQAATEKLGVEPVTQLLQELVQWIPNVIGAIAIFLAGYGIAIYTKDYIIGEETIYADLLGKIVFFFVLYISVATALPLAGVQTEILNNILLILIASAGLGLAIGGGIAAGLGLKDIVQDEAEDWIDEYR